MHPKYFIYLVFISFLSCSKKDEEHQKIDISIVVKDAYSKAPLADFEVDLGYCKDQILGSIIHCDQVNTGTTDNNGLLVFNGELRNRYNETPPIFRHYEVSVAETENYTGSGTSRLNDANAAELLLYPIIKRTLRIHSTISYDSLNLLNGSDHFSYSAFRVPKAEAYNLKCIPGDVNTLRLSLFLKNQFVKDTSFRFTPEKADTSSIVLHW